MSPTDRVPGSLPRVWQYALVGGVVSIPLTLAVFWGSPDTQTFSFNMVAVGGFVAGFLARRYGVDPVAASVRAGLVGGLPAYVWIAPQVVDTATNLAAAWNLPVAPLLVGFSALVLLGMGAIAGVFGGVVGRWAGGWVGGASSAASG